MTNNNLSQHHYLKNKSKIISPFQKFVDKFIYFIGIFGPVMTIPQVWEIWVGKTASGVSVLSWGAYVLTSFFWLTYAIYHKQKPLIISASLWAIFEISIVIGTLIYG